MSNITTIETYKNRSDLNFHIQTVLYAMQRETGQYVSDETVSRGITQIIHLIFNIKKEKPGF